MDGRDLYKIGIVVALYVPELWVSRTLWRGLSYHLPSNAVFKVRPLHPLHVSRAVERVHDARAQSRQCLLNIAFPVTPTPASTPHALVLTRRTYATSL